MVKKMTNEQQNKQNPQPTLFKDGERKAFCCKTMNTTKENFVERRRTSCRGGSRKFCEKMGRKGKTKTKTKKFVEERGLMRRWVCTRLIAHAWKQENMWVPPLAGDTGSWATVAAAEAEALPWWSWPPPCQDSLLLLLFMHLDDSEGAAAAAAAAPSELGEYSWSPSACSDPQLLSEEEASVVLPLLITHTKFLSPIRVMASASCDSPSSSSSCFLLPAAAMILTRLGISAPSL